MIIITLQHFRGNICYIVLGSVSSVSSVPNFNSGKRLNNTSWQENPPPHEENPNQPKNCLPFCRQFCVKRKKFPTRLITQYAEGDEAWNGEQEVIFSLIHKNSSFEGFHEWSEHHTHTHTNTRLRSHAWILVVVIMDWLVRHRQSQCRFLWRLDLRFCICFDFNYSDWSGFLFNLFITFYLLLLQLGDRQSDGQTSSDYCCY